jgi:hypothetical protein
MKTHSNSNAQPIVLFIGDQQEFNSTMVCLAH